ncbi:MAG: MarR family transcriptional regulator [Blautia sp.]|nr:MarR family transcriptional regulator [Blautia sp.]
MNPLRFVSFNTKAMKAYETICQPVCRKFGLNQTCFDVIMFLANNPAFNTAKDLWEIRGIRSGNASVAIEALVKRNLLKRQSDPDDRRIQRLILTEETGSIIEEGRIVQRKFEEQATKGLSEEERKVYRSISEKIQKNIIEITQKRGEKL